MGGILSTFRRVANSRSWREFLLDSRGTTFGSFRRDGGDFEVSDESTISALRWKYVFRFSPLPPKRRFSSGTRQSSVFEL